MSHVILITVYHVPAYRWLHCKMIGRLCLSLQSLKKTSVILNFVKQP